MKKLNVGLVDYGMGNLHSVSKALTRSGAKVTVSSSARKLINSDLLVVPGVGSFGAAMKNLSKNKLDRFIKTWVKDGKPYLGICLGLQLLFEKSDESKNVRGLGLLKGKVISFKGNMTIPHMGWNQIKIAKKEGQKVFKGMKKDDSFYFVHTYFPKPADSSVVLTRTPYGGKFCSSIQQGNVVATQFHPEKSGELGLKLLKNIFSFSQKQAA